MSGTTASSPNSTPPNPARDPDRPQIDHIRSRSAGFQRSPTDSLTPILTWAFTPKCPLTRTNPNAPDGVRDAEAAGSSPAFPTRKHAGQGLVAMTEGWVSEGPGREQAAGIPTPSSTMPVALARRRSWKARPAPTVAGITLAAGSGRSRAARPWAPRTIRPSVGSGRCLATGDLRPWSADRPPWLGEAGTVNRRNGLAQESLPAYARNSSPLRRSWLTCLRVCWALFVDKPVPQRLGLRPSAGHRMVTRSLKGSRARRARLEQATGADCRLRFIPATQPAAEHGSDPTQSH